MVLQDARKLLAAVKVGRGANKELSEAVKTADENLTRRMKIAERENAAVYLQVSDHIIASLDPPGILDRTECARPGAGCLSP